VSNTVAHLTSFLAFIDNSVNWWKAHGMDVSGAFTLAIRLDAAFFHEVHQVARAGVSSGFQTQNRAHLASQVWWGVCCTQDVTKEFVDKGFQNHGVISGEYIRFVVESSQAKSPTYDACLKIVAAEVKTALKEAKEAKTASSSALSKANTVQSHLDGLERKKGAISNLDSRLTKMLTTLEARVKALENKS